MERFVRYHFQDNSVFVKGEQVEDEAYLTSTINENTNKFYPIYVTNRGGSVTLSSEADHALGKVTAHVLTNGNAYNLMTRDLTLNNSDKEKPRRLRLIRMP